MEMDYVILESDFYFSSMTKKWSTLISIIPFQEEH